MRVSGNVRWFALSTRLGLAVLGPFACASAQAADWSDTEFHLQIGNLDAPAFAGGGSARHMIYTLQHASGWTYGDNFFFVDIVDSRQPGAPDMDFYSEAYANLSLGKPWESILVN